MKLSSTLRSGLAALAILASLCLSSCAVPLAPGYRIKKESLNVQFVPGNPPHLAIRAEYRLVNAGNAPLSSLEFGLPDEAGFGRANLRVEVDGKSVAPLFERAAGDSAGESADTGASPATAKIEFSSPWLRKRARTLHLDYDLTQTSAPDPRMFLGSRMFLLNDSGWFPDLLAPKAFLAKNLVRPDPTRLTVEVPSDFLADASGRPRGKSSRGASAQYRFDLRNDDFDPYVIAGQYQQQKISIADGTVVFWAFKPISAPQAQQSAARAAAAAKLFADTFGPLPRSMAAIYDIELPNSRLANALGIFASWRGTLPGVVYDWTSPSGNSSGAAFSPGLANAAGEFELASTWFGHMIHPRSEAWVLNLAFLRYASDLLSEKNRGAGSRNAALVTALQSFESEEKGAAEKPIRSLAPRDWERQFPLAGDKLQLFFFALEDKCGAENVQHALRHMVYALRGEEYGYADFRAALEQECHQDLAAFFHTWLDEKGIPADFRAKYEPANADPH